MNPDELHRSLRRWPDVEAENLQAHDAADRLLLEHAAPHLERLKREGADDAGVVVIGDRYGALTLPLLADVSGDRAVGSVRVWQDLITGESALDANARRLGISGFERIHDAKDTDGLYGPRLLGGARLVLLRLPKNLSELAELSQAIARHAHPEVVVLAAGMVKHMTRSMNEVLAESFETVSASLAKGKARVLTASSPRPDSGAQAFPTRERHDGLGIQEDLEIEVYAHGAVFAGTKVDIGTRFLLTFLPRLPQAGAAIDLGCGSGVLATLLAASQPGVKVVATDVSAAAVRSARLTAQAHGVGERVLTVHADALQGFPSASADLILLNPPFHLGHSVHAGAALKLFQAAAEVLAPGGELWTVWNSHLGYLPALEKNVGPTEILGRNNKFTVTRTRRQVVKPA